MPHFLKYDPKQMPENYILIIWTLKRVAEYFPSTFCIFTKCSKALKNPYVCLAIITTTAAPIDQIDNVDMLSSDCLHALLASIQVFLGGFRFRFDTFLQSLGVVGSGLILIARQSACQATRSSSAPNHNSSSSMSAL